MDLKNKKDLLSDEELDKVAGGYVITDGEPNQLVIAEDNGPAEVNVGLNDM